MMVEDISGRDDLLVLSDTSEVARTLYSIGLIDQNIDEVDDFDFDQLEYGCLFVGIGDGEYTEVYGCERSIPWLKAQLDQVYPPVCSKCNRITYLGDYQVITGEVVCRNCWR